MTNQYIILLNYLTALVIFLPKTCVYEDILEETNRIMKGPDLDFGEFLQLIGIWMVMADNPGTN